MGVNNSSRCVVKPVFDALEASGKIICFLRMVLPSSFAKVNSIQMFYEGHPKERVFRPRPEFLDWCRANPEALVNPELARKCLKKNPLYVFEGGTHPDIFIETPCCNVVIEAKWTEPRITAHTTWRKEGERDQLLRHMDALTAFNVKDCEKPTFGLFLIDANGKISRDIVDSLFAEDWYYKRSLPHRVSNGSWRVIKDNYRGVFTWQELVDFVGLKVKGCCLLGTSLVE